MNWEWAVTEGLITGDPAYYSSGRATAEEVNHAIETAYKAADDAQRKQLVDMAWESGKLTGDKDYWYGNRSGEAQDFAAGYSGVRVEAGEAKEMKDYNDADEQARFLGVPGKPQVWKDTDSGKSYLMYEAVGTEPPVPLLYEIGGTSATGVKHTVEAFFGEGVTPVYDIETSSADFKRMGAVIYGTTNNIKLADGDPWLGFIDRIDKAKKVQPWLLDDEILAIVGGAYIEGRDAEIWEFQDTVWWKEHNPEQRDWLEMSMGDPSAAVRKLADDQSLVRSLFDGIGADGTDPALIKWIGEKFSMGDWTQSYATEQVEAVTSGWYDLDGELSEFLDTGGIEVETSQDQHQAVRALWNEWLGPAYQPSEADIAKWATKVRNSADGQDELINMLRGQRLTLYSEYEDPNATYQDIAGPWKNMMFNTWGETADEQSDTFQQIIRMNDYTEAGKVLRKEGLAAGNSKVWDDATKASSGNVRRAI